jgi:hypothetical protein
MPQPPFLVDALQIEPGAAGTRTLDRDAATGAIQFVDAIITGGVLLPELVGLRNITGVFVVGRAGDGAPYTSIQDAVDAIPNTSNAAAPSVVLMMPGVYQENVVLQKDGVYLASPGGAKIINSGVEDTLVISASTSVTPLQVVLRGVEIENTEAGQACVRIDGADSFASATVTVNTAPLAAGDTITINGTALTGIAASRTSGSDDFSTLGGTTDAIAAEIAAAINDTANSFATLVEATVLGSVVTLTAVTAGAAGNAITLVSATTPGGGLTDSGATLSGGGAAGSVVGSGVISIEDCKLVASAAGSFQLLAVTVNYIDVRGGTWRGSASTSEATVFNCAAFRMFGVEWANDLNLSYSTGSDQPSDVSSAYEVIGVGRINDTLSSLVGAGSLLMASCPRTAGVTVGGDRSLDVRHSSIGTLTLSDTTAATLRNSARTGVTLGGGTPTLAESRAIGSQAFAASASEGVAFVIDQPDSSYQVLLESPTTAETLAVTSKTASNFTISASGAITGTVGYTVLRDL